MIQSVKGHTSCLGSWHHNHPVQRFNLNVVNQKSWCRFSFKRACGTASRDLLGSSRVYVIRYHVHILHKHQSAETMSGRG